MYAGAWALQHFSFRTLVGHAVDSSVLSIADRLAAQYFPAADHIVVLGEHGIVDQGSWRNIKIKAASIAKFSTGLHTKNPTVLSANYDRLSAQLRTKAETEADLARHTGDPTLYGKAFSHIFDEIDPNLHRPRVLFGFCRRYDYLASRHMHRTICLLHNHPPILASAVDRVWW